MPPVTKDQRTTFRKDVDFVAKDDAEQVATGIVMVPWAVDLQGDWERPETIEAFADQFATFEAAGEAGGGVMHAVWPDDHIELRDNLVLEEDTDIGGETAPAGAWVQRWHFADDELWQLVADDVLSGYSIGAVAVEWQGPMGQDDLPDEVSVPDEIDENAHVWELVDGIIREVSAVDIPAVPDAQILETKAAYEKRLSDHLGNRGAFIEEALERGHTEAEAERLWDYLNRAIEVDGADTPGEKSLIERVGATVLNALTAGGRTTRDRPGASTVTREDVLRTFPDDAPIPDDIEEFDECVDWAEENIDDIDPENFCGAFWEPEEDEASASAKEGRTLSAANRDDLKASIDAAVSILNDAGVEHGITRFTDREDDPFDLSEHAARSFDDPDDGDENPLGLSVDGTENHASEGDTSGPDGGGETATDMSNEPDTDPDDETDAAADAAGEGTDEKSLAEQNAEQIAELTESVESLTDALTDEESEERTATIEVGGEVYEVTESEAKAWFEDDPDDASKDDDPSAEADDLASKVEALERRLEMQNRQSGKSGQLHGATELGGEPADEKESALDGLARALN